MKKLLSIVIALSMCLSLAACGGSQPAASENPQSSTTETVTPDKNTADTNSGEAALPMNIGEAYTCNIGGYEGYVSVTNYEIVPDEMNEGCEVRTAYITAMFPGAPESHSMAATVFPAEGNPEAVDEMAWLIETEYGEELVFEYDNFTTAMMDGETLRYDITLSYMVPADYDEISFAVTDGSMGKGLDVLTKTDMVSSDTRWFIMGGYDNGVLTYNGNAVATAAADADSSLFGTSGSSGGWADSDTVQDEYNEEYYEETETPSSAGYRTLSPIQFGAITECSAEGRTISFGAIELVECYEDTNVINVTINYSGHQSGDTIHTLMYDAYNELHLDEQEEPVSGNGSVTFVFSCPANTAPYTFSMITRHNGQFIQNNIHIDVDVY